MGTRLLGFLHLVLELPDLGANAREEPTADDGPRSPGFARRSSFQPLSERLPVQSGSGNRTAAMSAVFTESVLQK